MIKGGDFIRVQRMPTTVSVAVSATGQPIVASLTSVAIYECDLQYDYGAFTDTALTNPLQGQTVQLGKVAFLDLLPDGTFPDIREKDVITDVATGDVLKAVKVRRGKILPHVEVKLIWPL